MKWNDLDRPTRLKLIGVLILLVGLGTAAWIYLGAENAPHGSSGYANEGGTLFMPEITKQYRHELEVYGGKTNVMIDDFSRWFGGLWHGKALAKIIAFFSIVISIGFFYVANHPPIPSESETGNETPDE